METGSNIKRLRDSAAGESIATCVIAGPGDLVVWEVRVTVDVDGQPLEVTGRGTDLEIAASASMPILTSLAPRIFGAPEISRFE